MSETGIILSYNRKNREVKGEGEEDETEAASTIQKSFTKISKYDDQSIPANKDSLSPEKDRRACWAGSEATKEDGYSQLSSQGDTEKRARRLFHKDGKSCADGAP